MINCIYQLFRQKFVQFGNGSWHAYSSLIIIYLIFVISRFIISLLIQNPLIPTDELAYKNMAYSFFTTGSFYNTQSLSYFVNIPNVLYPFLISPSFFLKDNFYAGIKLINSVIINTAIFPAYFLTKEFTSHRRALILAILVLLLPTFNFINYVSVDGPNLPLFLFCFFYSYKFFLKPQPLYAFFVGMFLALLVFNKPTAIAFGVALLLSQSILAFYFFWKQEKFFAWQILKGLLLLVPFFFISSAIISLLLKGDISYNLGVYRAIPTIDGESKANMKEILLMIIAQYSTFLIIYYVPFISSLLAFIKLIKDENIGRRYDELVFLVLGFSLFIIYTLLSAKYMTGIYNMEHFERIHARYHFMTYPFFLLAFGIYAETIKWNLTKRLLVLILFIILSLLNFYYFLPKHVIHGLTIFDNPDLSWHVPPVSMDNTLIILLAVGIIFYLFLNKYVSQIYYLLIFTLILVCGNIGEIKNIFFYDTLNSKNVNENKNFIRGHIDATNASVVLIDSRLGDRLWTAFWLPYNYRAVYDLPKGTLIRENMIPEGTQYIVLFDQYLLNFPAKYICGNSKCTIMAPLKVVIR
jgi:hypothetical protein